MHPTPLYGLEYRLAQHLTIAARVQRQIRRYAVHIRDRRQIVVRQIEHLQARQLLEGALMDVLQLVVGHIDALGRREFAKLAHHPLDVTVGDDQRVQALEVVLRKVDFVECRIADVDVQPDVRRWGGGGHRIGDGAVGVDVRWVLLMLLWMWDAFDGLLEVAGDVAADERIGDGRMGETAATIGRGGGWFGSWFGAQIFFGVKANRRRRQFDGCVWRRWCDVGVGWRAGRIGNVIGGGVAVVRWLDDGIRYDTVCGGFDVGVNLFGWRIVVIRSGGDR